MRNRFIITGLLSILLVVIGCGSPDQDQAGRVPHASDSVAPHTLPSDSGLHTMDSSAHHPDTSATHTY